MVRLERDGYFDEERRVKLDGFESRELDLTLRRETFGTLVVGVEPYDAELLVDGALRGQGPMTLEHVLAGSHELEVRLEGYTSDERTVRIEPEEVARVEVRLEPLPLAAPLPAPPPTRRHGPPAGRIVLNSLVSIGSVSLLSMAAWTQGQAKVAHDDYLTVDDPVLANQIYDGEVRPRQTTALVSVIGGGVAAGGATVLWATTPWQP
jgi:hypothetical protein